MKKPELASIGDVLKNRDEMTLILFSKYVGCMEPNEASSVGHLRSSPLYSDGPTIC